jgi:hypothetical protein
MTNLFFHLLKKNSGRHENFGHPLSITTNNNQIFFSYVQQHYATQKFSILWSRVAIDPTTLKSLVVAPKNFRALPKKIQSPTWATKGNQNF